MRKQSSFKSKISFIFVFTLKLALISTLLISCSKKKNGGGSSGGSPATTVQEDPIFQDGFEETQEDAQATPAEANEDDATSTPNPTTAPSFIDAASEPEPTQELTLLESTIATEEARAPAINYLFDHITDIRLNTSEPIPELTIKTHLNPEYEFEHVETSDSVLKYVFRLPDSTTPNKFSTHYTATITFQSSDTSIALIQITDVLTDKNLSVLRIQKIGAVEVAPEWAEIEPKVNQSFLGLLQEISYHPKAIWTHYHVLANPKELSHELARAEKVEIEIADNFKFTSLDIKTDTERLSQVARLQVENLKWMSTIEMVPGSNASGLNYLNPSNYYVRKSNRATYSFAKNKSNGEYSVYLNVPTQDYKKLLNMNAITVDTLVRPNVNIKPPNNPPHPFRFTINLPVL